MTAKGEHFLKLAMGEGEDAVTGGDDEVAGEEGEGLAGGVDEMQGVTKEGGLEGVTVGVVIGFLLGDLANEQALLDEGGEGVVFIESLELAVAVQEEGGVTDADPIQMSLADVGGDKSGAHGGAIDGQAGGEVAEGVVGGFEGVTQPEGGAGVALMKGLYESIDGDVAGDGAASVGSETVADGEEEVGEWGGVGW